ncbi:MAG: DUF2332 domain-containing protein, partial [Nocardioidaceae bacterium]
MSRSHLASTFEQQARACARLGSPMYEQLLDAMAADIDAAGPTRAVLVGHEDDPGPSALALRLLGSLHRLVLDGSAPALAPYYPSLGGAWDLGSAWPAIQDVLAEQRATLNAVLDQAPQTNDVGRSAALLGGLLHVADRFGLPVRLHEIGASAGLNLRADHFQYGYDGGRWGPPESPVVLSGAWRGPLPPIGAPLQVVERHGTDLAPIDVGTRSGRTAVMSYVWPDMRERLERLRGALALARAVPAVVERGDAVDAVRGLRTRPGSVTVLWHSVMWQYLDLARRERVAALLDGLGAAATPDAPFAHLYLEPQRRAPHGEHEFLVVLQTWPGGGPQVLGTADPHGVPT